MNSEISIEMFSSFVFLLIAFSFIACFAQRLHVQYRLEKIKERRGDPKDFSEKMEMERLKDENNDNFYIYL